MKYTIIHVSCLLLLSASALEGAKLKPMKIKLSIIDRLIDGNPALNPRQLLDLQLEIKYMREGLQGEKYLIEHQGKKYSLKQMVKLEKEYATKNPQQKVQFFSTALDDAHKKVEVLTKNYLHQARMFKGVLVKMIEAWASQRGIKKTILNEWSKQGEGHELKQLKKLATTFADLEELLSHLSLFLIDFRESCPKSFGNIKK